MTNVEKNGLILKENRDENAFMFIANENMKFALAAMLVNLQEVITSIEYDVVVLYDGFTEEDLESFRRIEKRITFIEYTLQDWEEDYKKIESEKAKSFIARYTHLAYCKYRVFEVLKQYKRVLFLDLDMIVRADISELFQLEGVAWKSGVTFHHAFSNFLSLNEYPEILEKIPSDYSKPNGGLIYAALSWEDAQLCLNSGYEFIVNFIDKIRGACDELAMAWAVGANNISLTQLDRREYNVLPRNFLDKSKVMHFMGTRKPWSDGIMQLVFPEWFEYYDKALAIAAFSSEKVVRCEDKGAMLLKTTNQDLWLRILSESGFQVPYPLQTEFNFENPVITMRYNNSISYGLRFDQDGSVAQFYMDLWITDKKLINTIGFLDAFSTMKIEGVTKINVVKEKNGLHVYTVKIKRDLLNEKFKSFATLTMDIIQRYMVIESCNPENIVHFLKEKNIQTLYYSGDAQFGRTMMELLDNDIKIVTFKTGNVNDCDAVFIGSVKEDSIKNIKRKLLPKMKKNLEIYSLLDI